MTTASICTIGDEILIGQIVDTNSSHISQALNALGVKVNRMTSIGDDHDTIVNSLAGELKDNDIVIVTGGLGPTKDDITKAALAHLSGTAQYKTDERQLEIIHKILSSRGLDILDINIAQASVPQTCEVIPNKLGTAPIMVFRFPKERCADLQPQDFVRSLTLKSIIILLFLQMKRLMLKLFMFPFVRTSVRRAYPLSKKAIM